MTINNKLPPSDIQQIQHENNAKAKRVLALGKTTTSTYVPLKVDDDGSIFADYLKLDCSNDPLTGQLTIQTASPLVILKDTEEGNTEFAFGSTGQTFVIQDIDNAFFSFSAARGGDTKVDSRLGNTVLNAPSGKNINLTINDAEEYVFSATTADFKTNNLTTSGNITGTDLTSTGDVIVGDDIEMSSGKSINIAGATVGTTAINFSATAAAVFGWYGSSMTPATQMAMTMTPGNISWTMAGGKLTFTSTDGDIQFTPKASTGTNIFQYNSQFGTAAANSARFAADGELSLHGTARVTRDLWIDAAGIKAPGAKPATEVSHGDLETSAWQFADEGVEANQQSVSWRIAPPYDMDRSAGPVIRIGWSSASTGNVKWQLEYRWLSENEDTTAGAEETLTAVDAASTTSNGLVVTDITGINAPSSTDASIFFRLTRLSADGQDTITDTVELHGVCYSYTSDKLGEPT